MPIAKPPSLIVRLPNWVGDVLMALPALQMLQNIGINLQLIGRPWASSLLAASTMNTSSSTSNFWQMRALMAKIAHLNHIDHALILTNSFSSALMAHFAGLKAIGYKTDARSFLLASGINKPHKQHESQHFWDIACHASAYCFPSLENPTNVLTRASLTLSTATIKNVNRILTQAQIQPPFWVLCPFAHGKTREGKLKIWPHWSELSRHLTHKQLIVCPNKYETKLCAQLVPDAKIFANLNLAEYAAILAQAQQVIANDSGPMHLAASVGAPTLGIFGVSDPKLSLALGASSVGSFGAWPSLATVLARLQ